MKEVSVMCWVLVSSKLQRLIIKTLPFTYDNFREKNVQKLPAIWDSGLIYQRQTGINDSVLNYLSLPTSSREAPADIVNITVSIHLTRGAA